ncbi:MAG TPA: DUF4332 domain-containing protein, partial [Candidatus Thermoplasmatota archaeon]|nr:DUF4332 domain-containing protein [Candidatus Thermoplasmatota archaeon]
SEELGAYTAEAAPEPVEEDEEEDLFGVSMAAVDEDDLFDYSSASKRKEASTSDIDLAALELDIQVPAGSEPEPAPQGPPPALDEGEFVIDPNSLENRAPELLEEEFLLEGFEVQTVEEQAPAPEETEAFEKEADLPPPIESLPELDALTAPPVEATEEAPWPEEQPASDLAVEDLGFIEEPAPQEAWSEAPVEPEPLWTEEPEAATAAAAAPAAEAAWTEAPAEETAWAEEAPAETWAAPATEQVAAEEIVDFEVLPDDEEEAIATTEIVEESWEEAAPAPEPAPAVAPAVAEPAEPAGPDEAPRATENGTTNVKLLEGVGPANRRKLRDVGVQTLGDILTRTPEDMAQRSGIPLKDTKRWWSVADLTVNAGIPLEYAEALAATGIVGVAGLREMREEEVVNRLAATSHRPVTRGMVASWKRRV